MKKIKWVLMRTPGDYRKISRDYSVSSIAAIAARNRGVELSDFDKFFHISKEHLHDPALLKGADELTDYHHL